MLVAWSRWRQPIQHIFRAASGFHRFAFLPGSWGFFNVAQTFLSVLLGFSSLKLKTENLKLKTFPGGFLRSNAEIFPVLSSRPECRVVCGTQWRDHGTIVRSCRNFRFSSFASLFSAPSAQSSRPAPVPVTRSPQTIDRTTSTPSPHPSRCRTRYKVSSLPSNPRLCPSG